ncbi:MAG: isoamylase early set domain-containing protein [Actinomycetes bacterium]
MRKQPGRNGSCKVTFELPAEVGANAVHVCGDFNDWSTTATPLKRRKDGTFAATLTLEAGRRYRFRYLLGDGEWENDWAADDYVRNEFGGEDSVVAV